MSILYNITNVNVNANANANANANLLSIFYLKAKIFRYLIKNIFLKY